MDAQFHRKLVAILAADVVGYSRLMEADEAGTLKRLQAIHRTFIIPIAASYGGRLIKTTGDGFLFEFASAVDAVLCAVSLQQKIHAAMLPVPEPLRLVLRTGIHAGDILSDGIDMFGDGVNVAARLEGICAPGGICMSSIVHEQLRGKVELPLVDLGEHQVKNISRLIHVFGIEPEAIDDVASAEPGDSPILPPKSKSALIILACAAGLIFVTIGAFAVRYYFAEITHLAPQIASLHTGPSIAVLPFVNLNTSQEQSEFADALADNLRTDLSVSIPDLTVIESTSAFTYRDMKIDPLQIGRELNVGYLLKGSIQRIGDDVRVNAQLVETHDGRQIWTDHFDGKLIGLGSLQDEITARIANALNVELAQFEANRLDNAENSSALGYVFRGEALMNHSYSFEAFDEAEKNFRQALQHDPNNLSALTDLGELLAMRILSAVPVFDEKRTKTLNEAEEFLDRVQAIAPRRPGLHNALGLLYIARRRVDDAARQFKIALEINPNSAAAYLNLASCLTSAGKPEEAIPLIEKSIRLNPRNPNIASEYIQLGWANFALQKYPEAAEHAEHAIASNPGAPATLYLLASSYALQGKIENAKTAIAKALEQEPGDTISLMRNKLNDLDSYNTALADRFYAGLRLAGLPDK